MRWFRDLWLHFGLLLGGLVHRRWPVLGVVAIGIVGGIVGFVTIRRPHTTPVMRGQQVAQRMGCLACHATDGARGVPNLNSALGSVPPFDVRGALMFYVQSENETREWILYGAPARIRADTKKKHDGLIKMPAYDGLLSERELSDLIAYVRHAARTESPAVTLASKGREVAQRTGCFGCHGADGRGGTSNPGSFKGYIPPWDGKDFDEVVKNTEELQNWILDGKIERFENNPLARFFTSRQIIKMPAYKDILKSGELEELVAYIEWLRTDEHATTVDWVDKEADLARTDGIERGRWLYREAGCIACHGVDGKGAVPNANYVEGTVPQLDNLAEKMGLGDRKSIDAVVGALAQGHSLEGLKRPRSIPNFDDVLEQYHSMRKIILAGSLSKKRKKNGVVPPMHMPSWRHRAYTDGGPVSQADIDSIIAYLLTLQSLEAEDGSRAVSKMR